MDLLKMLKDSILNPEWYILNGGFYLILLVVFAETGLFVGFFLPGDSMLIVSGIYSDMLAKEFFDSHYLVMMAAIALAGILGNFVGYWFGNKYGSFLYKREDTFLFKKKYLFAAKDFYEQRGAFTVIIARFLPIVRTFVPIVAGIVKMDYKKFVFYNVLGSILWVYSLMLAGRFFHQYLMSQYGFDIRERLEILIIVIVAVTTLPIIYKFIQQSMKK